MVKIADRSAINIRFADLKSDLGESIADFVNGS